MSDPTRRRILFVDDEPNVLRGLRRMLRSMRNEWDMAFAECGSVALDLMAEKPFDLVVSDMRMPGMTGVDLLKTVMERSPQTIRFILSGQADRESILRSIGPTHQFLSKPCDPEELRRTVAGAFALRDILSNEALVDLVSQTRTLPSLPDLYLRLQELLRTDEASIQAVGELVEQDVGMCAKILQLVNSAFFGLRVPATTAAQAVSMLGMDTIRSLALLSQVFDTAVDPGLPGLSLESLHVHSLGVGAYAREVARGERESGVRPEDAYMAGVLHDAGLLVLLTHRADEYREILGAADAEDASITELERAAFGASHAEVGAYLLGIWGLPDPIVEAAAFHHEPDRCSGESFSVLLAVHCAHAFERELVGSSIGPFRTPLDEELLDRLELTDRLPEWRARCEPFEEMEA